jgi:hypothetical protein
MAPAETTFSPTEPAYITPITCPNCGGKAILMRRSPIDGGEERTFECVDCKKPSMLSVAG